MQNKYEYATYLFDVGGTLITVDERRRAQEYVARASSVGVIVSWEDVFQVLDTLSWEMPERMKHVKLSLLPKNEQRAYWLDFWAEGFRKIGVSDRDAARFARELLDSANGGNYQIVFKDVVPALEQLRARGKRMGIISNFSPNCEPLLQEMGLADYFDFFVVSGILGIEKPDARIFHAAIEASGRNISELVYVGDSLFHDVEGAQNVGMNAILIDRANRFTDPEIPRIRDLREL